MRVGTFEVSGALPRPTSTSLFPEVELGRDLPLLAWNGAHLE